MWDKMRTIAQETVFQIVLINCSKEVVGSSHHGTAEMNPTRNHEVAGSIPGLSLGLGIPSCRDLWCRLQIQLGSPVAVAVA